MLSRAKNKVSVAAIVRGTGEVPVPAVQIVTMASAAAQIQPAERASGGLMGYGTGGKSHSSPSPHPRMLLCY